MGQGLENLGQLAADTIRPIIDRTENLEKRSVNVQAKAAKEGTGLSVSSVRWATVTGEQEDYLECTFHDIENDTDGAVVNVAKPIHLRKTTYDDVTVTYPDGQAITYTYTDGVKGRERTATNGAASEVQRVVPEYHTSPGEVIMIVRCRTGVTDANSKVLRWQEVGSTKVWVRDEEI
jgi:hypothetical protein